MSKQSNAHSSEVTTIIVRQDQTGTRFISTGLDGFIKLNNLEP